MQKRKRIECLWDKFSKEIEILLYKFTCIENHNADIYHFLVCDI